MKYTFRTKAEDKKYKVKIPQYEHFDVSPDYGLTEKQAVDRIDAGLYNKMVKAPSKTVSQIIIGNTLTFFNLIFFILGIALLIVGSYQELMFLLVVVINLIIGIIQELNAKHKLDQLVLISEPKGTVVREGNTCIISTDQLVLDDIVIFKSGNQVYADSTILAGQVLLNESLVTGESEEIVKIEGDSLLSGSFIVSGECRARLDCIGEDSYVSKLTLEAKKEKKRKTNGMMKSLTGLLQVIGVLIIPIGALLYRRQTYILGLTVKEGVENTTGALVGMIPSGLYLLVTIALAASVVRISQKKMLVHDFKSIETLARVDVLCVDKTGTITGNEMEVIDIIPLKPTDMKIEAIESLLNDFVCNIPNENTTMHALKRKYQKSEYRKAIKVQSFSSATKFSSVSFSEGESYILGAPEFILGEQLSRYRELIEGYTSKGERVLLFSESIDGKKDDEKVSGIPIALVLLDNPIRPTAKSTFDYFTLQGVEVKVISGDNALTAAAAARSAGIPGADRYIDASTLNTTEKLKQATQQYTVFGRVSPNQKREIILILQKEGHIVAMTGDGVNDVLALKVADCSIAMASGSEVASQVSDFVLLESNFDAMPSVVAEGRRVINNIERTASLFLVKNIFSFALALISITAVFAYPVSPSQLSLISTLNIGIPSFFLALEPNSSLVRGSFLSNILYNALPAAMTDVFIVMGAVLFSEAFSIGRGKISTVITILLLTIGFMMLWRVSTPFNLKRALLFGSLISMFFVVLFYFPSMFSLSSLDFGSSMVLGVLMMLIPSVLWIFTRGINWLASFYMLRIKREKFPIFVHREVDN